jgi:transposase
VAPYARKTHRLTDALRLVGFALGGAPGARLSAELGLGTSAATILRRIEDTVLPPPVPPRVVGLDDWAWKKGRRYGTVVVDLERKQVLDLLPDREIATVAAWLHAHPTIEVVSRDRASGYAEAIRQGAPHAIQVTDRFHLLMNLTEAVQTALASYSRELRTALGAARADVLERERETMLPLVPMRGTDHHRDTKELRAAAARRARRLQRFEDVKALHARGYTMAAIAQMLHLGKYTVFRYIHAPTFPERAAHPHRAATPYRDRIRELCRSGPMSYRTLYRMLAAEGCRAARSTIQQEIQSLQDAGLIPTTTHPASSSATPAAAGVVRTLSPRQVAWYLLREDHSTREWTAEERAGIARFLAEVPAVAMVQTLALDFIRMLTERAASRLDQWVHDAEGTGLQRFARGLQRDYAAVTAALTHEWSNGPVEGQNNRLKCIKRTMYGRAGFPLLRQRILYHSTLPLSATTA